MPSDVAVTDLDAPVILSFLDHLEATRRNSIRSRNLRLAAIRSFFRYIALRDPESLPIIARILEIPVKRADHRLVSTSLVLRSTLFLRLPIARTGWAGEIMRCCSLSTILEHGSPN